MTEANTKITMQDIRDFVDAKEKDALMSVSKAEAAEAKNLRDKIIQDVNLKPLIEKLLGELESVHSVLAHIEKTCTDQTIYPKESEDGVFRFGFYSIFNDLRLYTGKDYDGIAQEIVGNLFNVQIAELHAKFKEQQNAVRRTYSNLRYNVKGKGAKSSIEYLASIGLEFVPAPKPETETIEADYELDLGLLNP